MFKKRTLLAAALLLCVAVLQTTQAQASQAQSTLLTKALMNTPRPLFFADLAPLDTTLHRTLTLPAQRTSFAFAARANLLPLTFAEVGQALHSYPIVFVGDGGNGGAGSSLALVALADLQPGSNRFVGANGEWRAGAYIPAYVRGYPFISVRATGQAEPVLALDPQAADFKAPGGQLLLLADGQPSEQLKGIIAFHSEYRVLAERTHAMVQALKDAGVLEDGSVQLQPNGGGEAQKIGGFMVVSEAKLKALSADALQKLMTADALGLAYAHLFSMGSLANLFAQPAQGNAEKFPSPSKTEPKRSGKKAQ